MKANPQSKEVLCYQLQDMAKSAHQFRQQRNAGQQDHPVKS
jgi:hypothetical protein